MRGAALNKQKLPTISSAQQAQRMEDEAHTPDYCPPASYMPQSHTNRTYYHKTTTETRGHAETVNARMTRMVNQRCGNYVVETATVDEIIRDVQHVRGMLQNYSSSRKEVTLSENAPTANQTPRSTTQYQLPRLGGQKEKFREVSHLKLDQQQKYAILGTHWNPRMVSKQ
jgi:hypothetical protein